MTKNDFKEAGRIALEALKYTKKLVKRNAPVLEICEKVEMFIKEKGGEPAFPLNVSINNVAAHYTALPKDTTKIPTNAVVKIDVGVHVNGAIVDVAETIIIGTPHKKAQSAVHVLNEIFEGLLEIIKDGVRVSKIGEFIWTYAHNAGFGVVRDLCGHQIERWKLHAGISIPNAPSSSRVKLRAGMIIAIEPFLVLSSRDTETVPDFKSTGIFSLKRVVNDSYWKQIWNKRKTLPFALRWIPRGKRESLINLLKQGKVNFYPPLLVKYLVVQKERTFLVEENSCRILGE